MVCPMLTMVGNVVSVRLGNMLMVGMALMMMMMMMVVKVLLVTFTAYF